MSAEPVGHILRGRNSSEPGGELILDRFE